MILRSDLTLRTGVATPNLAFCTMAEFRDNNRKAGMPLHSEAVAPQNEVEAPHKLLPNFKAVSFYSPDVSHREQSRSRAKSNTDNIKSMFSLPKLHVAPTVPAPFKARSGSDISVDDEAQHTPDVEFDDISNLDVANIIVRASAVVNVDDLYKRPGVPDDDKIDCSNAEYQGMVEFLVLCATLRQVFMMNLFVVVFRIFSTVLIFLPTFLRYLRDIGPGGVYNNVRYANWRRVAKGTYLVSIFLAVYTTVVVVLGTIYSMLLAITFGLASGDTTLLQGIAYGVEAYVCYARAVVQYPLHNYSLGKWRRRLPDEYVPIGLYKLGVVCLYDDGSSDKRVLFITQEDRLRGHIMPMCSWKSGPTAFESVLLVSQGSLEYVVYWKRFVQVTKLDTKAWPEWDVWNKRLGSPPRVDASDAVSPSGAAVKGYLTNQQPVIEEIAPGPTVYQGPESGTEFSDLIAGLNSIPGYDGPTVGVVADVVALITVVMETRSKSVLVTQAMAMAVRYPQIGDAVMVEIRKCIERFEQCSDETFEDGFITPVYQGNFSTGFKDTEVGAEFMSLISLFTSGGLAATLGILDIGFVKSLQTIAIHLTAFETLETVIKRFAKFVMAVVKVLKRCWETKSLAPLYEGITMNPTRYVKLAGELMNEVRIRDSSNHSAYLTMMSSLDVDLHNGQLSEGQRLVMMEELYVLGERFESLKRSEHDAFVYQIVLSTRAALKREIDSLNTKAELNRFKPEPYSVGLAGPPGIGKSFLVRSMQRIVAVYLKIRDSASIGFQWKVGQKYADGLTSAKRVYVFDDTDQKVGAPAFADQSPYVDWILVRNSKPTMANMAEAQDKGRYAYNSLMAMWVSNKLPTWKDVRHHVSDPHAFARRFNDMWWCSLAPGVTRRDMELGKANDDSWVFTEYAWNESAGSDNDPLFVPTGKVVGSRLQLLAETAEKFTAKMLIEKGKMDAMNALDEPACTVCGISCSDHFGSSCEVQIVPVSEATPAATFFTTGGDAPSIMVYQGPAIMDGSSGVSPMEQAAAAMASGKGMDVEQAKKVAGYWVVGLYFLHIVTMFWGMWFLTLILEAAVLGGATYFASMDEEGKIKVALMLFPKSTLMWLFTKGLLEWKMPTMDKIATEMKAASAMDKLKYVLPVLTAVGIAMWAWSSATPNYQSVKTAGDEIVREQPKKEQWLLAENTPRSVSTPAAKTFNETGFKRAVESCVAVATVGGKNFPLHYLNSKTWWTNAHHLLDGQPPRYEEVCVQMAFPKTIRMGVKIGSYSSSFEVDSKSMVAQIPGRDVVLIRLDDMVSPGAGMNMFLPGDIDVNAEFVGAQLLDVTNRSAPVWREVKGTVKYKKTKVADKLMLTYVLPEGNAYGMCGSILVAPTTSGGWLVLGGHSAGMPGLSLAEPLTRSMVESVGASLYVTGGVRRATDVVAFQSGLLREPGQMGPGSDLEVVETYARTHVNSAVKAGAKVLMVGTIKGFRARKFASDVLDSPFKDSVVMFAKDQGVVTNYVNPSKLIERRDGEDITSPFTQVLTRRKNVRGDQKALDWAVEDYLGPIEAMLREQKPYVKFTYAEAFSGTGELTKTNLATSTGPPYNSKKSSYLEKQDNGDWKIEPNLARDMELVSECLGRGEIPGVVINDCVKAEAISSTKAAECRQRILEVGPTIHSTKLKRLLGWLAGSIKSNKALYEMSIGMNVYGLDAERLYDRMRDGRCFDGDLEMQDGCTSTQYMDAITQILMRLCAAAGMPDDDQEELRLLLLSFGDRLVCILGDVFIVNGGNPSGWYGTAVAASLVTILLLRCTFYLAHMGVYSVPPLTSYRAEVATEVQGDDNINCVAYGSTRAWFSGVEVTRVAPLYGHKYTSADKGKDAVEWKDVSEISYLKRCFSRVKGQVVMPLELKSIAKQLMFYKKPAAGSADAQLAVNLTNASRELSLHGPVVYEKWMEIIRSAAAHGEIEKSRFYDVRQWEETFDGVLAGTLDGLGVETVDISGVVYQSAMDAAPNLTVSASDATQSVEVVGPPVSMIRDATHSAGDSAQHRAVKVKTQALTVADVTGTVLTNFELIDTLLANTQLADIFDKYWSFNFESITLRVQHNSSGSMYGRYVVCVVPEASMTSMVVADTIRVENCTHASYHYMFNPANNEDFEFTIPWFGMLDSRLCASDTHAPRWRVSIICVCPLTDAVNSAGASTSTLSLVANFNKVNFGSPVYQGPKKNTIKISAVAETVGAVGTMMAAVVPGMQPFLPVAMGLAAAGKALAEMGHTRHRAPSMASPMMKTAVTGLGPVDGQDRGIVCDWVQAAQVTTAPDFSGCAASEDEMSFKFLAEKKHIVAIKSMAPANLTGYVLASVAVTPYAAISIAATAGYCYHPLAHATMMCAYWRSTMYYDVCFSCNALQSGTVFAFWSPASKTEGTTISTDFISGAAGCIIEIDPAKRYRIKIPWFARNQSCRVKGGTVNSTRGTADVNGYVIFVVMNPVSAPYVASVQMVIEMSVGDDFQVGGSRPYTNNNNSTLLEQGLVVQGTITQTGEETEECTIGHEGSPVNLDGTTLSCTLSSVKALCQRYCHYPGYSVNGQFCIDVSGTPAATDYKTTLSMPFYPTPPTDSLAGKYYHGQYPSQITRSGAPSVITMSTGIGFTMIGWLGPMYTGVRGGMSHKVIIAPRIGSTAGQTVRSLQLIDRDGFAVVNEDITMNQGFPTYPLNLHGAMVWPQGSEAQSFDFVMPYNSVERFYPINTVYYEASTESRNLTVSAESCGDFTMYMLSAGAADFSLAGFRFSPIVDNTTI